MNVAIPSNVLEWITNDQPKFSFLAPRVQHAHVAHAQGPEHQGFRHSNPRSQRQAIRFIALPNYNLTLVFEMADKIEYTKEFLEYNKEGWRKAHPIRRQ